MKVVCFDFDGTLASTNEKPETNKEAIAAGWSGKDWWGSECSLKDIFFHENVRKAFETARNDPDTRTVMLTGRRGVISRRIREILREEGFPGKRMIPKSNRAAQRHFNDKQPNEDSALHEEYFTGDFVTENDYPKGKKNKPVDNTLTYKTYVIKQILMNKFVTEVELWDDRKAHIQPMLFLARELLEEWTTLQSVVLHQVFPQPFVEFPHIINHTFVRQNDDIAYSVTDGN